MTTSLHCHHQGCPQTYPAGSELRRMLHEELPHRPLSNANNREPMVPGIGFPQFLHIRWMIRRDMPEVLRIEQGAFGAEAWCEEDFLRCLRQRNCIGMVVEHGTGLDVPLVGYMIYEMEKKSLELLNFAVAPWHCRQGVGRLMVAKLMAKLSHQRRTRLVAYVRETNFAAHLFFRDMGFTAQLRRNYYDFTSGTTEDAYRFTYRLPVTVEEANSIMEEADCE